MSDLLETLRKLQAIDAELFRLRHDQQHKPLELERMTRAVAEQQAHAQSLEAHLKTFQLQQKEKDMELATREAHIKKLQAQLFQVKTNKEYSAIQHEIEQAKADVSLFEEEILKLMDSIDTAKRQHAAQLAQVANAQDQLRLEQTRIDREIAEIEQRIAALEQQREGIAPSVDATALSTYERILESRKGLAMVPLMNDSCGGCHMVQPPQVISEAYLKTKLVTCDSCNRILYVDDAANGGH